MDDGVRGLQSCLRRACSSRWPPPPPSRRHRPCRRCRAVFFASSRGESANAALAHLAADDAASPIYNCVVRFKVLRGAAEAAGRGDGTQCDARDAADALERALAGKLKDKKFLLILTPSDLELYAARDFCREGDEDGCAAGPVTTAVTAGGNFLLPAFIRSATGLPCDPLTLANAKAVDAAIKLVGKVASTLRLPSGSSPPAPPAAASPSPSSPPAPTAEELEADEVVTLSVALSQARAFAC